MLEQTAQVRRVQIQYGCLEAQALGKATNFLSDVLGVSGF